MNINLTLLGQMLTFGILVWVTMRYVWPPLTEAMEERRARIAQGEASAIAAEQALLDAKLERIELLKEAQKQKDRVLHDAELGAKSLIADAKSQAKATVDRILAQADQDVAQKVQAAKEALSSEVASLVINLTEKLLKEQVDEAKSTQMINEWLSANE
jgi:F-type H+-transporting ATPase subunit b